MKHYGDITKLSGWDLPVVDCITGGSPCQDLSVAGPRAGLNGKRSGLFMEQIRIVKEMRERDKLERGRSGFLCRPRFMVWENVPGAFSSNRGRDFRAVLTEIAKIAEPEAHDVPMPETGRWPKAGCVYDNMGRWSVAWRVHDAQFWGVPQRRKRISLVADFGGLSAPEILFEREGLPGDSEQSGEAGEETAGAAGGGVTGAEPILLESNQNHATVQTDGISTALPASMGMGGGYVPMIVGCDVYNQEVTGDVAASLTAASGGTNTSGPKVLSCGFKPRQGAHPPAVAIGNGQLNQMSMAEQANTLDTMHDQQAVMVAAVDCRNGTENPDTNGTLQAKENGGQSLNYQNTVRCGAIVRRLTPLECERLQGYPDGWTDIGEWTDSNGKKHKVADSPRYKALGNSIALPFWFWLLRRISAQYERPATLGSLFDGIGGFPLCWERCNGPGTAIWASEIEEFPIAVTKKHFPEGTT